jgi:hypothetical protein
MLHFPLSTKLLSNHPSPPSCSHSVIPASPSNYWGIISVWLLMYRCNPVTCEPQHYLPGFPHDSINSLTTKTDVFYLLPSSSSCPMLALFCAQQECSNPTGIPWTPSCTTEELTKVWDRTEVQCQEAEKHKIREQTTDAH